jgi:thioredoxin reductase (NADPH)
VQTHRTKVGIIGSGPAGYTAALYAARASLEPVLVSGHQPGGQLTITTEVENYPGFPKGVLGPELMELFKAQAEHFGTRYVNGTVSKVELGQRPFRVVIDDEDELICDTLIVATGATAKLLGLPSETELMGYGVSACATCDGFFFKNKEVAVVGGGDTAMEEATYLTKHASRVTVIHRRETLRASKIMQEKAMRNPKIAFIWNTDVIEVLGERQGGVTGLTIRNNISGEEARFPCQGFFVAIGHDPTTKLFKGLLDVHENGYLRVQPGTTRTNVAGVFACGDVQDSVYRQAITAAGSGCMAAIDAERFLSH